MLAVYWPYVDRMLDVYWPYIVSILAIPSRPLSQNEYIKGDKSKHYPLWVPPMTQQLSGGSESCDEYATYEHVITHSTTLLK